MKSGCSKDEEWGCCVCFTKVRWFYDKNGLHLKIKWNVQGRRHTLVSFCKLQCHSQLPSPTLQFPLHLCPLLAELLAENPRALERSWQRLKLLAWMPGQISVWKSGKLAGDNIVHILFVHFNDWEHSSTINARDHKKMFLCRIRVQISHLLHPWFTSVVLTLSFWMLGQRFVFKRDSKCNHHHSWTTVHGWQLSSSP